MKAYLSSVKEVLSEQQVTDTGLTETQVDWQTP